MFEGIRDAVTSIVKSIRSPEELSLSITPKSANVTFDQVSAGWYGRNGYSQIYAALSGGLPAWSGEPVSTESSLSLSTVWACNKVISESVGFLPLNAMRRVGNENQLATELPMYSAMKYAPNCEITTQSFTELLTSHTVLQGNSFARVIRRSGTNTAVELYPILPQSVLVDREKTGQKRLCYIVKEANQPDQIYTVQRGVPQDILHIRGLGWDGVRGYSVIQMARQSIGTALAQERNVASYYGNGGRIPYILKHPARFKTDQDFDKFRADWEKTYSQPHKVPILEDGLTYEQIGLSAADAQLIESRNFTIPEICRWFNVSPTMVQDLTKATFSNIENLAAQFVRFTLAPWLYRWEQEMWRCVLTPDEQAKGYYFRHDVDALQRSEFATRMSGYATQLQNGIRSINEVRDLEGENPISGGDSHYVQLNMAPVGQGNPPTTRIKVGDNTL